MYRGVKTPRGPMYRGVAKLDPLLIQNSPKYRGVKTPRCPMYRGVKTPRCPKYRGVAILDLPKIQNVLSTGESFFVSLNLQVHATAFKATLIQKTI